MSTAEARYQAALKRIATLPTGSHQTTSDSYGAIRQAKQIAQKALAPSTSGGTN